MIKRGIALNNAQKDLVLKRLGSLYALAKKTGISYQAIHAAFNGKSNASFESIYKIAVAIEMDFEKFKSMSS
ncbi:MAG: helix-turn-helix transcriptional regulator [Candidatus Abawacabacteria bacterium]|nr:helix-turn-helix transcriptional regulator [Candidatus Abawacabacteria bacterium]